MITKFLRLSWIVVTAFSIKTNAQSWKLTGNAGTDTAINFLGTTDNKPIIFRTNNLERMRIQIGKVGIGTKKPAARLNIISPEHTSLTTPGALMLGDATTDNLSLDANNIQARYNRSAGILNLNYFGGAVYLGQGAKVQINNGSLAASGIVGVAGGTNVAYALNVNAASSLGGINITDPVDNYVLFCNKSGAGAGIYVSKTSTATATPCIEGYGSGSAAGIEGYSNTGNGVYGHSRSSYGLFGSSIDSPGIYGYSNNAYAGRFISNSYRGIYAEGNTGYIAGYFAGSIYTTGAYVAVMNASLSKNIKSFDNAMDIINKLQPKNYEFRNDGYYAKLNLPEGLHYGLIAEDVEQILPGLIKDASTTVKDQNVAGKTKSVENINDKINRGGTDINFKALNYTELIPIIIKGIQEQELIINKQQQEIDELKQLIQNITNASNSSDTKATISGGAYLMQNSPNPFTQNTTVRCYVPSSVKRAQLLIYNLNAQLIKSFTLTNGVNNITINAGNLPAGEYSYSLIADGKKVDTKNMTTSN